jgi:uncharacterized protein (TIGR00369 family)
MAGFAETIGITALTAEDGEARAEVDAAEQHLNPAGTVHGGVLATLVDTTMGAAVRSTTGEQDVPATSQLTIAYLRPGSEGRLTATAHVGKQGEHLLICQAQVEQDGRTLVEALATFAIAKR